MKAAGHVASPGLLGAFALLAVSVVIAFGLPRALNRHLPDAVVRHTSGFGSEFMPTLEEGSLLFMPVLLPATSLSEVQRVMSWQDKVISQHPEVASVGGKLGRAESATDPAPIEMIETTIMLKPESEWRTGMTKDKLIAEMIDTLRNVPGSVPGFLQPIENRILMLATGIRAQLGVKILGDNLDELQKKAFEVERIVRSVPGAIGVAPSRVQAKNDASQSGPLAIHSATASPRNRPNSASACARAARRRCHDPGRRIVRTGRGLDRQKL